MKPKKTIFFFRNSSPAFSTPFSKSRRLNIHIQNQFSKNLVSPPPTIETSCTTLPWYSMQPEHLFSRQTRGCVYCWKQGTKNSFSKWKSKTNLFFRISVRVVSISENKIAETPLNPFIRISLPVVPTVWKQSMWKIRNREPTFKPGVVWFLRWFENWLGISIGRLLSVNVVENHRRKNSNEK